MPTRDRSESGSKSYVNLDTSRRRFLAGTGTVASLGMAGCTGSLTGSGTTAADSISVAAAEGSGTLFKKLIKEYVEEDTGVTVDVSLFPYANLLEKVNSVFTSQSDAYDVVMMDDPWFPQFAGDVAPLEQWTPESLPKEQIIQTCLDIATWPAPKGPTVPSAQGMEKKIRGQVLVGNTQLFAYNKKYYEDVGADTPPKTWSDVYETGKKISEQIDGANGYIIRGKRGNPINANFFGLGMSKAGDMFDKNWRYRWDEQQGVEALDFYVNKLKSISPDGVASFDSDQVLQGLADGTAAQAPAWPSAASLLLDPEKSDHYDNIAFTVIPEGTRRAPQQGNWIAGINKYASDSKKQAAGNVIHSAVSKEAQQKYVELGGVPFRHDTFEENMDAEVWFEALYESLQTAKWRPRTPLWTEIAITQGKFLNTALTGNISPKEALTKVNDQVESTLEGAGYYR